MANPSSNSGNPSSTSPSSSSNLSGSSSSSSSNLTGNASSTIREAADRFTSQINKADPKQIMSDASEAMNGFYGEASRWISENRTVVTYVGIGLVAGLMGFMLGRSNSSSMDDITHL